MVQNQSLYRDYSLSNMFTLVAAVVLLISFIFLPWIGSGLTLNGARVMSDNLYGAADAIPAPMIWLVPVAALFGIGAALVGILAPERERTAAFGSMAVGALGLIYFIVSFIDPITFTEKGGRGLGFWLGLAAVAALILNLALTQSSPVQRITGRSNRQIGKNRIPPALIPYLFLAPALILYLAWIIGPTLYTFYLSLTSWDAVSAPKFIGFANFERLFTKDRGFVESLVNNLRWLIVFITIPTTLGLLMAMVFNTDMRFSKFYKISFYLPLVLSLPVIGLIWSWVYNPRLGLINNFLTGIGVGNPPGWLGERALAIWCVIAAAVWRQVGYVMVLYLAGLKNLDPTLIDAAHVDGAGRWAMFRHVVFPLLAPVTTIVVVISIIDSLRAFDLVSIMTRGGQSTQVLANFMYIEAFNNYRMGYGAAIAVVLFAISMVFISFYLSTVIKDELEY